MKPSVEKISILESEIATLELVLLQKRTELAFIRNSNEVASVDSVSNDSDPDEKVRLFRSLFRGREDVLIFDYADLQVPVLSGMHNKRLKGYKALGYSIDESTQ